MRSRYILSTFFMTGGATVFAQLYVLGTMPIATRFFDEAAFGVFGLFVSLTNLLTIGAHLGLAEAILATPSDRDARYLAAAVVMVAILAGIAMVPLSLLVIWFDLFGFGALPYRSVFFIVGQIVSLSMTMAMQAYVVRGQRFRTLALSTVILGATRGTGQVVFGFFGLGSAGLLSSELVSRAATAAFLLVMYPAKHELVTLPVSRRLVLIRRYRSFAIARVPTVLLSSVAIALPTITISSFYSINDLGQFTLMNVALMAPLGLVQRTVGDVLTGIFGTLFRTDPAEARRFFWKTAGLLAAAATLISMLLMLFAVPIFTIVFGESWLLAGEMAQVFAPALFLMIFVLPISTVVYVIGAPVVPLHFSIVAFVLLAVSYLAIGSFEPDIRTGVYLLSAVTVVSHSVYFILIYWAVERSCRPT